MLRRAFTSFRAVQNIPESESSILHNKINKLDSKLDEITETHNNRLNNHVWYMIIGAVSGIILVSNMNAENSSDISRLFRIVRNQVDKDDFDKTKKDIRNMKEELEKIKNFNDRLAETFRN